MKSSQIVIRLLFVYLILALPLDVEGRDLTLNTDLSLSARYDDNVLFTRTDAVSDYSSIVTPHLRLAYRAEQTKLDLGARVSFNNYLDQTDLDNIKHNYYLDSYTQTSERTSLNTFFKYIKDSLLDSELEETGRVFNREERERYIAGAGLGFEITTLSRMGLNYNFSRYNYEVESREDRDMHSIGVYYQKSFNERLDSLRISPTYRFRNSETIDANDYSVRIGWKHKASEKGAFNFELGGRYTEESRQDSGEEFTSSGLVADISYEIEDDITRFQIGYDRDINYDANNDLREVDHIYLEFDYKMTERLWFKGLGDCYLTRSEREDNDDNTSYFDLNTRLEYYLTERHSLGLGYRYSLEYDSNEDDETVGRNRVILTLALRFPNKL